MKRKGKVWFFVVAGLILFLTYSNIFGISDRFGDIVTPIVKSASEIRFGIDIRGGVDVTFEPAVEEGVTATPQQMDSAQAVIEARLIGDSITDYEIYKDVGNGRIILRFPWKADEVDFDPRETINELALSAVLTFREGTGDADAETGEAAPVILQGGDVQKAESKYADINGDQYGEYYVELTLSEEGRAKNAEATARLAAGGKLMSVWLDDDKVTELTVNEAIDSGTAIISGSFTADDSKQLADTINAGSLPFALSLTSYSTISPALGAQALRAMVIAGVLAFIFVAAYMIIAYRLPGAVSAVSLLGQIMGTIALISGYFVVFNSSTLTLPGIAGIILAIGMGVDANVITAERIKEELRGGKKLDAAIKAGFQRGLSPIVDGNVTVIIVAAILMGAFGPTDGFFAVLFKPIFFAFGPSTAGTIYSFGYTLLVGVLLNFVFGVLANRAMLTSLSRFRRLRAPVLYGGLREGKADTADKPFNIVGRTKRWFSLSGAIVAALIVCSFTLGVQMDVQFRGGAIVTYRYSGEVDTDEVLGIAGDILGREVTLQQGVSELDASNSLTITVAGERIPQTAGQGNSENVIGGAGSGSAADVSQTAGSSSGALGGASDGGASGGQPVADENSGVDGEDLAALLSALNERYPTANFTELQTSNVSPSIGGAFLAKCVVAVLAASLLILAYVAVRFRRIGGWRGGVTAVVALVHDLIIVYGVFVVFGIPLSGNFIAALLTILGYSINDTVVIYDRVRENRGLYGKHMPFGELVNLSINQSLRRSVNTTFTTLIALGCVCIFSVVYGLDSILTFAFPLMVGMVSGVYSTVCIAGPLWVRWNGRAAKGDAKASRAKAQKTGETK